MHGKEPRPAPGAALLVFPDQGPDDPPVRIRERQGLAAREQQGLDEAEIRRLEGRLAGAQTVEEGSGTGDVVFVGSMVKIKDVEKGRVDTVKLVGEASGDIADDYDEVTVNSPMGEALMKARIGETVRVNTPRGVKRFEVVEIL